jgi:hypothetical protein
MPKVRRRDLPQPLFDHLLDRVYRRHISIESLHLLADWLAAEPVVPPGRWYKRFPGMTLCGEGELIKTFLLPNQTANGQELD